jgi:hypothetical protein
MSCHIVSNLQEAILDSFSCHFCSGETAVECFVCFVLCNVLCQILLFRLIPGVDVIVTIVSADANKQALEVFGLICYNELRRKAGASKSHLTNIF